MRVYNVVHQEPAPGKFDSRSQFVMKTCIIRVATDGRDRGNLLQFQQDFWQPNIPRVQDMFYPLKERLDFGIKEIMRIRNNSNLHRTKGYGVIRSSGSSWLENTHLKISSTGSAKQYISSDLPHAFASSGSAPSSGSPAGAFAVSFSLGDS